MTFAAIAGFRGPENRYTASQALPRALYREAGPVQTARICWLSSGSRRPAVAVSEKGFHPCGVDDLQELVGHGIIVRSDALKLLYFLPILPFRPIFRATFLSKTFHGRAKEAGSGSRRA